MRSHRRREMIANNCTWYRYIVCQTIIVLSCCALSRGANILGVFPFNFKSHFRIYDSLMVELAKRGHNVTVISMFPKTEPLPNFRDVDVSACDRMWMGIYELDIAYKSHEPFYQNDVLFSLAELDRTVFDCPPVKRLLAEKVTFDAVIAELFCSTAMMAFAEKFNVTSKIWFSPVSLLPWGADIVGNPYNPAYTSYQYSPASVPAAPDSTFGQRFYNTMVYLYAQFLFYRTREQQEQIKQEFLGFTSPSLAEIVKDTSLILTFSHFSVSEPVPLVPNVVEVGGLQIQEASALPQDLETFISESEHGVIYFSFGSLLKLETMPPEKLSAFMKAFSKIKQRVVWKWGDDTLPDKTDDIFIAKWMPQRDILAHPNVKLFIGHGGALGVNEAVYEGVPILGIPLYADQTLNLRVLEKHGAAEIIEYTDINHESVMIKLTAMLNDKRYSENMKQVSRRFKDRPMSPLDTAVYWVEYVIRHGGAPALRSAAADMSLYQYLLLDVIAFILLLLFVVIFLIVGTLKIFFKLFSSTTSQQQSHDTKKTK